MTTIKCKLTFIEGLLGTAPNDKEIYGSYIGSKAPDAPDDGGGNRGNRC